MKNNKLTILLGALVVVLAGAYFTTSNELDNTRADMQKYKIESNRNKVLYTETSKLNKRQSQIIKAYGTASDIDVTTISAIIDAEQEVKDEQAKSDKLPDVEGGL